MRGGGWISSNDSEDNRFSIWWINLDLNNSNSIKNLITNCTLNSQDNDQPKKIKKSVISSRIFIFVFWKQNNWRSTPYSIKNSYMLSNTVERKKILVHAHGLKKKKDSLSFISKIQLLCINPVTPTSDQDRISPHNVNTISTR